MATSTEQADKFVRGRLRSILGDQYAEFGSLSAREEIARNLVILRMLVAGGDIEDYDLPAAQVMKSSVATTYSSLQFNKNLTVKKVRDLSILGPSFGAEGGTSPQFVGTDGAILGTAGEVWESLYGSPNYTPNPTTELGIINSLGNQTSTKPTVTGTGKTGSVVSGGAEFDNVDRARLGGKGGTTNTQQPSGPTGPGTPGDGSANMPDAHDGVFGIPAGGEVWKVDGKWAVAYQTENGGPWIYYTVPDDDSLKTFFPGGVPRARKLSQEEADRLGAITPGSTYLLRQDGAFGKGWEEGFNKTLERESLLRPWLSDPEVVAVYLAAALEGRQPTTADLESTDYFKGRSDAEVDYVAFEARASEDELKQYHLQFEDTIKKQMQDAGIRSPDPSLVSFVARRWASGAWSDAYAARQVMALSNPYSSIEMDADLAQLVKGTELNTLKGQTETIKAEVQRWLGPLHSKGFSDEWYRQWAGAIMDDPNAENDLRDFLQGQRMALYPEYENPNLTYEDISGVWAGQMQREWGVTPADDKEWGVLDRVIRANDSVEAGKILRTEGVNLGVDQVQRRAMEGFGANIGDQVVTSF